MERYAIASVVGTWQALDRVDTLLKHMPSIAYSLECIYHPPSSCESMVGFRTTVTRKRNVDMPKKPKRAKASATTDMHEGVEPSAARLATLKDLRKAAHRTQEDLALALDVGQGTISRLEKRSDMLLSTLRMYVESIGGTLEILVTFPDRPPLVIDRLGSKAHMHHKGVRNGAAAEGGKSALA